MSGFGTTIDNYCLDQVFSTNTYNPWVALYITAPAKDGTGTEVSGTGYTRIKSTGWTAASSGYIYNSTTIAFPTAGGDWGTVEYFAVWSSSSAGNIMAFSSLTTSKTIASGDSAQFSTGQIVIRVKRSTE